jgi:hypothetical protein
MTEYRPSYELSMQIHIGVITFRPTASGDASRDNVLALALFADDDPCTPLEPDRTFKELEQSTI